MIIIDVIIGIIFVITISIIGLMHIKMFWKSVRMFKDAKNLNVFDSIKTTDDMKDFVDSMRELMEKKKKDSKKSEKEGYERGMYR